MRDCGLWLPTLIVGEDEGMYEGSGNIDVGGAEMVGLEVAHADGVGVSTAVGEAEGAWKMVVVGTELGTRLGNEETVASIPCASVSERDRKYPDP